MWPFKSPILSFDQRSRSSLGTAQLFALNEGTSSVNALHLFKAIIHCGDPTVGQIFDRLQLGFEEDAKHVSANSSALSEKAKATNFVYTAEVKKALARANRCAIRKARQEVVLMDLLRGLVDEAPGIVQRELSKKQITLEKIRGALDA